jgi:methyl-accepting chemotaxis protein
MDESRNQVQAGVSRAEKAGQSLAEILESIQGVSAMMARIASLAGEQQQVVGDIVGRADRIAASIDDTLGQTAACDKSCVGLAGQSARLYAEVSRFRVA